jgi:hypothetical protein
VTEPTTDPELRRQLADAISALGKAETELAALRKVARGYCPACGRGDAAPTVEDWERERQRAEQAEQEADATASAAGLAVSLVRERAERAETALRETLDCIIYGNGQPRDPNDLTRWRAALPKEQPRV